MTDNKSFPYLPAEILESLVAVLEIFRQGNTIAPLVTHFGFHQIINNAIRHVVAFHPEFIDYELAIDQFFQAAPTPSTEHGAIPEEYYQVAKFPEFVQLQRTIVSLTANGASNPYFRTHAGIGRDTVVVKGRPCINFSSYNYLGLSGHPHVTQAARQAIDWYGTSVSARRLVSGQRELHTELEHRLANFLAVQNTYLSTFQTLGGLGLLLGTIGLGTVMLRNVIERRAELALLRAVGFRPSAIRRLVLFENAFLLACGLVVGTASALLAMLPHLLSTGADVPWLSGAGLLLGIFAAGLLSASAATIEAVRTPIVATLRGE